ncbi:MAG: DUF3341 domain-containing protein [Phycisphaerales bacterium]
MSKTYTAIYEDPIVARRAIERLLASGVDPDEISVLMSSETQSQHFDLKNKSKALEGIGVGGAAGGALGALVGGLTAVGGLALTGGAGVVVVGPLVAALTGAGVGAGTGGALGGLIGLGIPEHEAKLVEEHVDNGGILVAVHIDDDDRAKDAKEILDDSNAKTVNRG